MELKIQSIRFSKDFFEDFESCAKWLDKADIKFKKYLDLENSDFEFV